MRNNILQLLICTLVLFSTQAVNADDLNKFDANDAEMNLLKEEESFLSDLLKDDYKNDEINNPSLNKDEDSKIISKENLSIEIEEPIKQSVSAKPEVNINKAIPSPTRSNEVLLKEKEIKKISNENFLLKKKLADSQNRIKTLQTQLAEMRDNLILAETEVERLGNIAKSDCRNISVNTQSYKPSIGNSTYSNRKEIRQIPQQRDPLLSRQQEQKTNDEMPIATVIVDKANLRAGPGTNNSPIMTIGKGTRLAIETRQGDWYRVVAPTGERAWISRDTIAFGRDPRSSPSRTVKVQGANRNEEEMAIELIRKR